MLPTAKHKENFFGETITKGNKKKLSIMNKEPIDIKIQNVPMLLSTLNKFINLFLDINIWYIYVIYYYF